MTTHRYLERLDRAYSSALAALAGADVVTAQRVLNFALDEDRKRFSEDPTQSGLNEAMNNATGEADLGQAAHILTSSPVLRRQAQLQLLDGIIALDRYDLQHFVVAISASVMTACFMVDDSPEEAEAPLRVAWESQQDEGRRDAVCLWAAKFYASRNEWRLASRWLERVHCVPEGPIRESYQRLVSLVERGIEGMHRS